jgi:hypothetical protein
MSGHLRGPLDPASASKQARDAQIFVGFRPLEIRPVPDDADCCTLLRGGMEQTMKPREGNGKDSTVDELNDHLIVRNLHVGRPRISFNGD